MQPVKLELLAPAKNSDIGIAAIDCGADAVYIAGPGYGARAAAGNPVSEIARLCDYAHKFSARIFGAVNTIVFENELPDVERQIWEMYDAGVDALIVQDLGITRLNLPPLELHASTQCAIRTPEKARMLEDLGFKRLILERQLSLDEIGEIRASVHCELEFFVHGAICVCYSGNCYLSQYLTGRSANRGACIQACRSLYDVVDGEGQVLARDRAILSPKDYCLDNRLEELAEAGICSFKIEGRLKGDDYVKNITRYYRERLDALIGRNPRYGKASDGILEGGFKPNLNATFNRGYTQLYIDGVRYKWNSLVSTKSIGEQIGVVEAVSPSGHRVVISTDKPLANGDGLVFVGKSGLVGMRADVVNGNQVTVKDVKGIAPGDRVWRNYNIKFEKELAGNMPRRKIDVEVIVGQDCVTAADSFGCVTLPLPEGAPLADNPLAAMENFHRNLGKRTAHFDFRFTELHQEPVRFYGAATLNALRRDLAAALEKLRVGKRRTGEKVHVIQEIAGQAGNDAGVLSGNDAGVLSGNDAGVLSGNDAGVLSGNDAGVLSGNDAGVLSGNDAGVLSGNDNGGGPVMPDMIGHLSSSRQASGLRGGEISPLALSGSVEMTNYTANCANPLAKEVLQGCGYENVAPAYELQPVKDAALMRSRYCVKFELGLCPKLHPARKFKEPLYLLNGGKRLRLQFDCKNCEMIVTLP